MKEKPKNTLLSEIKVTENAELLNFLVEKNVRKSRNATKSLLVHKQIKVNNKVVSQHNHELKPGDIVSIHKQDHKLEQKKLKGLTIIYEDKDLVVVDKESGLLSVSTGKELLKETAYNIINEYVKGKNAKEKAYVLFRLDRETSGLMVFAKKSRNTGRITTRMDIKSSKTFLPGCNRRTSCSCQRKNNFLVNRK